MRRSTPRTLLVSAGWANGEIGTLQPIDAIARACRERGVLLHSDAAQALGKIPVNVAAGVDLLSLTAHKLYGPKGVGALWVRPGRPRVRIEPLFFGGGHENGLRPGTLPVPLIVGFGRAVEIAVAEREVEAARLLGLRERLLERLRDALSGVSLNGHASERLPGNLNVGFEGIEADALLASLHDIALSTGSACSSARPEPSHVLVALGLPDAAVRSSRPHRPRPRHHDRAGRHCGGAHRRRGSIATRGALERGSGAARRIAAGEPRR